MASLDDLSKDPNWRTALQELRRGSLGTVRVVMHNGRLKFQSAVAGKFFDDPTEAAEWIQSSGFKKREAVDALPGHPVHALSPTGSYDYRQLKALSRDIRSLPGYDDVSIVREAYAVQTGAAKAQAGLFMRGGTQYGLAIPDDETTTVLRMFRGKDEMTQAEIRQAFDRAGLHFDPADTPAFVKLMKRLKIVGNAESMHAVLDAPLRVGVFADDNPLALQMGGVTSAVTKDMAKRNASGMSVMNPRVLMDMAKKMDEEAAADMAKLAGLNPVQRKIAERNIKASKAEAARLRGIAKTGGRLQDFRVTGLSIDDPLFKHLEDGMIKADVNVPALGDEWAEWVSRASPLLSGNVDPDALDIITVEDNVTQQLGRANLPSHITLKPAHMEGNVYASAQPLAAYGRQIYGGADYADVINESNSWFTAQLDHLTSTGELPAGYKGQLEKLLEISGGYNKNAGIDVQEVMRGFGIVDDASLMNQQARAQRILAMQAMGLNTATHEPMFREVAEGMRQSLNADSRRVGQFSGRVPVSARMHMQGGPWGFITTGEQLARGEFSVDPRFGLTYNGEDFVHSLEGGGAPLYDRFGGGDYDDAVASMLRLDEESGELIGVSYRDPMGSGEIAVLKPTDRSVLNLARMTTEQPGQNTALQQSLANVGFYDVHERVAQKRTSYEQRIAENVKIMNAKGSKLNEVIAAQKENDYLRHYLDTEVERVEAAAMGVIRSHVPTLGADELDTLRRAHVPEGMELLTTSNYEAYVAAQEKRFAGMLSSRDTPDSVAALFGIDPTGKDEFLNMDPYTFREWDQRLVRERGAGILGNYSLVREMADEYAKSVEDAGKTMAHPMKYLIQEAVIDPLTKGFSDEYKHLSPQGIEATGLAMLQNMVETAHTTGVKLDPLRLEHRFNPRTFALIPEMLNAIDPNATMEDIIMSDEEAANAPFGRAMKLKQQQDDHMAYEIRKRTENMDIQRAIKRTAFDDQALTDARAMSEAYHNAIAAVESGGVGIPNEIQEMTLGMVGEDTAADAFKSARAREAMQRTFSDFLEANGGMGDRATNAMGAFIQQYQGSSAYSAVQNGTLARAEAVARGSFLYRGASSSLGESAFYTADEVRAARDAMSAASTVTADYLKSGASAYTELPGEARAKAMGAAYDIAEKVKSGFMNGKGFARGPQGMSVLEHLKGFGELPGVRNVGLAVGAVVLASTIYRGVKDRTNHDMEGPPLLPGGSAYEDYYDRPTESMDQYHPPQVEGGVKYKVNTRGGDHAGFRKSAEKHTGAQSTGSTYNSRNYDRSGIPNALNGAF